MLDVKYNLNFNFFKNSGRLINLLVIDYIICEQEFFGNRNINGVKKNVLNLEIRIRFIWIYLKDLFLLFIINVKYVCLRLELYGCFVYGK